MAPEKTLKTICVSHQDDIILHGHFQNETNSALCPGEVREWLKRLVC